MTRNLVLILLLLPQELLASYPFSESLVPPKPEDVVGIANEPITQLPIPVSQLRSNRLLGTALRVGRDDVLRFLRDGTVTRESDPEIRGLEPTPCEGVILLRTGEFLSWELKNRRLLALKRLEKQGVIIPVGEFCVIKLATGVELRKVDTLQSSVLVLPKPDSVQSFQKGIGKGQDLGRKALLDFISHGTVVEVPGYQRVMELRNSAGLQIGNYPFVPKFGGLVSAAEGKIYFWQKLGAQRCLLEDEDGAAVVLFRKADNN